MYLIIFVGGVPNHRLECKTCLSLKGMKGNVQAEHNEALAIHFQN